MLVLYLSFALALLDQITKYVVRRNLNLADHISVIPGFFDLRHVRNTGAAWGMLSGFSGLLVVFSVVMLLFLIVFRRHFMTDSLVHRIAVSLMIAGIVGNLVDRIRLGHVVDFLDFYWRNHHFPAFNVADSAICTGVGLYMLSQFLSPGQAGVAGETGGTAGPAANASVNGEVT
jgi:signal peptidase II